MQYRNSHVGACQSPPPIKFQTILDDFETVIRWVLSVTQSIAILRPDMMRPSEPCRDISADQPGQQMDRLV